MVWFAQGPSNHCALKLLRPGFVDRPEGRAAFSRLSASIESHAPLHHPNLVKIYEPVQDPTRRVFGMAMEYIDGQTLAATRVPHAVAQGKDLDKLAIVLSWYEELGATVSWLHSQGIVHGNLKPTNVLLSRERAGRSVVKLVDLSWAAIGIAAPPPSATWSLAPEQLAGRPPTPAADQWALASMLARMLTGGHPSLPLGVQPQVLVMAVQRAMAESESRRYPKMADFVAELRSIRMEISPAGPSAQPAKGEGTTPIRPQPTKVPDSMAEDFTPLDRMDTPPLRGVDLNETVPGADLSGELPTFPRARGIQYEDSGGFKAESTPEASTQDDASGPKRRYEVGDPFADSEDLDDSSQLPPGMVTGPEELGALSVQLSNEKDGTPYEEEMGTVPTTPTPQGGSRLAAIGMGFLVVLALMAVAGMTLLGERKWAEAPTTELGKDAEQVQSTAAPQPPPPPPPPPLPVETAAPSPKPERPLKKAKPRQKKKRRRGKKRSTRKEIRELDRKAEAALKKLLGEEEPSSGEKEASVACDEGDGPACLDLGMALLKRRKKGPATKAFERACQFRMAEGCHRAAEDGLNAGDKAASLRKRACELGRAASCESSQTSTSS